MAKRTKSKKHPQNKKVAKAPTPEANENATPAEVAPDPLTAAEATADSLTVDPTIAEAPNSTVAEDTEASEPFADTAKRVDETVAVEADHAEVSSEVSSEYGAVWSGDEPVAGAEPAAEKQAEAAPTDVTEDDGVAWTEPAEGVEAALSDGVEGEEVLAGSRLESILESLLFASDKPLGLGELKRLLGERDGKKVTAAVASLTERRKGTGIEVAALSSGWHLRTNPEHAVWVSKLLVGRPIRLSRAMLETLAIVAYRQPVTRPEVDDIRGVDCGPVLKTLLDRGLVRIIGKKEEVGRPMLYGTTPEFLRIFNLRDLSELPTLREFYDLSTEDQSRVEAEHGPPAETPSATTAKPDVALNSVMRGALQPEPDDTDPLLDELDEASQLAKQALGELEPKAPDEGAEAEPAPPEANSEAKPGEEPPASPATE